ncbi:hypothetical protein ACOSP7_014153 [Xanthoceras sorbifolium]
MSLANERFSWSSRESGQGTFANFATNRETRTFDDRNNGTNREVLPKELSQGRAAQSKGIRKGNTVNVPREDFSFPPSVSPIANTARLHSVIRETDKGSKGDLPNRCPNDLIIFSDISVQRNVAYSVTEDHDASGITDADFPQTYTDMAELMDTKTCHRDSMEVNKRMEQIVLPTITDATINNGTINEIRKHELDGQLSSNMQPSLVESHAIPCTVNQNQKGKLSMWKCIPRQPAHSTTVSSEGIELKKRAFSSIENASSIGKTITRLPLTS